MNLFMMYHKLMGYEPRTISKVEFIDFYLRKPKAIEADKEDLHQLEVLIELHRQRPTSETYRKVYNGITFLIDQYFLTEDAKRKCNEIRKNERLLKKHSTIDIVIGELLVGLYRLSGYVN